MTEHIRCGDFPYVYDVSGILHKIAVGQYSPFRLSGGAGGLDDKPRIIRVDFDLRWRCGCRSEKIKLLIWFMRID